MAFHAPPKHMTWTKEIYINPTHNSANRYYTPRLYTSFGDVPPPHGANREKWFHDYRRSHISERILQNNLKVLGLPTPFRTTTFSDKPDRVLGARKQRRDAVLYNPHYHLTNRIPDQERDRKMVDDLTYQHRQQYRDHSGTLTNHRVSYFHYPTEAEKQFLPKMRPPRNMIDNYPNAFKASREYVWDIPRGPKHFELWHKVWKLNCLIENEEFSNLKFWFKNLLQKIQILCSIKTETTLMVYTRKLLYSQQTKKVRNSTRNYDKRVKLR